MTSPAASGRSETTAVPYRPAFLWQRLADRFAALLAATTFEDLCREAPQAAVRRADVELTYVI